MLLVKIHAFVKGHIDKIVHAQRHRYEFHAADLFVENAIIALFSNHFRKPLTINIFRINGAFFFIDTIKLKILVEIYSVVTCFEERVFIALRIYVIICLIGLQGFFEHHLFVLFNPVLFQSVVIELFDWVLDLVAYLSCLGEVACLEV